MDIIKFLVISKAQIHSSETIFVNLCDMIWRCNDKASGVNDGDRRLIGEKTA